MPATDITTLVQGQRYRVTYLIPGVHRKPRVTVADFIGVRRDQIKTLLDFSHRPLAGTGSIDWSWVSSIEHVDKSTPILLPKP